jgi:glycosyltransferase involved in cell wall biosynthesis
VGDETNSEQSRHQAALLQRLTAAAPHFGLDSAQVAGVAGRGPGPLLDLLARAVKERPGVSSAWLLFVALTAAFPSPTQVKMVERALSLASPDMAANAVLEAAFDAAARFSDLDREIEIVNEGVVVDVDFCANHPHNTGIQRVVRQTMSRWDKNRDMVLVAWTKGGSAMRTITSVERRRVVAYNSNGEPNSAVVDPPRYRIVVPVNCAVVLPEVPQAALCEPLAAIAEHSGNRVGLVGYDSIPVVSADMFPAAEPERFVRYLTIVKHSNAVAGISAAATEEFAGFVDTLSAQGLTGPSTFEVSLPVDLPDAPAVGERIEKDVPLILCVGSQEPRKNHLAVLFAAEVLWREGRSFRLRFIGGGSLMYTRDFDVRVKRLRKAGFDVEVLRGVNDSVLLNSYAEARFSVFPSLHEGYGLPVAESLALNTPSITSSYGSTAEIAAGGGCLTVDPRNDDELIATMRSLLTDEGLLARLHAEIATRDNSSWDDYADRLWADLVAPLEAPAHAD